MVKVKLYGKEVSGSSHGVVHVAWSDGSAVVALEDGRSVRVGEPVVRAAGLYGDLHPGQRVRVQVGDDGETAAAIEKA